MHEGGDLRCNKEEGGRLLWVEDRQEDLSRGEGLSVDLRSTTPEDGVLYQSWEVGVMDVVFPYLLLDEDHLCETWVDL
jgi:hypothetical protein